MRAFTRRSVCAFFLIPAVVLAVGFAGLPVVAEAVSIPESLQSAERGSGDTSERPDAVSAMVTARASGKRVEDLSQRSETTQVFANPDGTWTSEAASGPVRTRDEEGQWKDIDTTLVRVDGGFAPKAAIGDLVVSDGGDATFAQMDVEGRDLAWKWPDALPAPVVEGSTATYPNAVDGGDLVVTATPNGFRHDIVLREAPADPVSFHLPLVTGGPSVAEQADGGVKVTTKAGEELVSAPPPVMYDAGQNEAGKPDNVRPLDVTVTKNANGGVVTLNPDQAFLSDPETQYPVTIDPSYGYTGYATADTWVHTSGPDSIHPYDEELIVGTNNSGGTKYRSYIQFATGSWNNARILGATLYLRNIDTLTCTPAGNVYVQRVTTSWAAGSTTWNHQPGFTSSGQTYTNAGYGKAGCPDYADMKWTVTPMVQAWADHSAPNYGIKVLAGTETANSTYRKFRSANYVNGNSGVEPRLIVTYDHYPNKPSSFTSTDNTGSWLRSTTPTLSATVSDPNGGTVYARYNIYNSQGGLVWYGNGAGVASGGVSRLTVPAGVLAEGQQYTIRAFGYDGTVFSGNGSSTTGALSLTLTVDATRPTVTVSTPSYTNGQWLATRPDDNVFTIHAATDTTTLEVKKDGVIVRPAPVVNASGDVTLPSWNPTGGHELQVKATDRAGNVSDTVKFTFGNGALAMTSPVTEPLTTTTNTVPIAAAGPPEAGAGSALSARLRWRVAASGANASTGWTDPAPGSATLYPITSGTGSNAWVSVTGSWDTSKATQEAGSSVPLDPRKPVLFEVQVCVDYGGSVGEKCTWGAGGAQGEQRVLRVPHAFGGNYPVTDVAGGQVALWTGELSVAGADAVVPSATGDLSVSRVANSYEDPQQSAASTTATVTPSVTGVFGPGWTASLDGTGAGTSDSQLVDSTRRDGTLTVMDPEGNTLAYAPPGGVSNLSRRTTTVLPQGGWTPLGEETLLSGVELKVDGSGASTTVKLIDPDGTVTTYQPVSAPTGSADIVFVVASVDEPAAQDTTSYTHDSAGRVTRILADTPAGVGPCSSSGQLAEGCRALGITYATATTATSTVPGDKDGQISQIQMLTGSTTSTGNHTVAQTIATYAYDTSGRLVSVTDPRPTPNLTTTYTYDGSSNRLKTIKPAGLQPITYEYGASGDDANKLLKVTRTKTDGSTQARLATILYGIPVAGTDATGRGLPDLDAGKVALWGQDGAPTYGAAVFGPEVPDAPTAAPDGSSEIWKDADLTYTTDRGAQINTADYGAGSDEHAWTYTSTSYDEHDHPVHSLDAGDIDAILGDTGDGSAGVAPAEAGTETRYNTAKTVEDASVAGGKRPILEAGSVVTDTWGPARWILTSSGERVWARPRTHTDYDQNAPHHDGVPDGVNPDTGQAYALPTTVTVTAEDATPGSTYGQTVDTYSLTRTDYDSAVAGDADAGWAMGLAGTVTTDMTGSAGSSTADIVARTRYDHQGRVVSTSQPKSDGNDAGTRQTSYYTAGNPNTGNCVNSAWVGMTCKTTYGGNPAAGPAMVVSKVTAYSDLLAPKTVEERTDDPAGTLLRTTTTSYLPDGRTNSAAVFATAAVSGSTPVGTTTYDYYPDTGLPRSSSTTAAGGSESGVITTGYDSWGRSTTYTTKAGDADPEQSTTSYDAAGRVVSVRDPKGTTSWTYNGTDAAGNAEHRGLPTKINITNPGGRTLDIAGAYDHGGSLVRQDLPGGVIQRTSYDAAGEPTSLTYNGQVSTVDDNGNPVTSQDKPWLAWSQTNDALGRVRREWTPSGAGFEPGGADGNATGASATGYARDYTYDRAARLVGVTDRTVPNPEAATGGVDPEDAATMPQTGCQQRDYAFDRNGNRTSLTRTPANADGTCQSGATPTGITKTWSYDAADRLTGDYAYDALGRATTIPQDDTPAANASAGTGTPSPGALTLGYYDTDAAKSITQNGTTTTFTLDAAGRRLASTTVSSTGSSTLTRHYADSSDNPAWTSTSDSTYERYAETLSGDLGLTIATTSSGTTTSLQLTDLHGDTPTQLTLPASGNATGIDNWMDTDEYGNPLATASGVTPTDGTSANPAALGYGWLGGKQRATDGSGLVLMGARLYNPTSGQFTSVDPVSGGNTTHYSYPQDPINSFDVTGMSWCRMCDKINRKLLRIAKKVHGHTQFSYGICFISCGYVAYQGGHVSVTGGGVGIGEKGFTVTWVSAKVNEQGNPASQVCLAVGAGVCAGMGRRKGRGHKTYVNLGFTTGVQFYAGPMWSKTIV